MPDLGGSWDKESQAWIFPGFVADEVDELDEIFNSDPVTIEITAITEIRKRCASIDFIGRRICKAFSRASGARIETDIALVSGYATSGGSYKNWETILEEGAVLRLQMPGKLLENYQDKRFDVKIID